MASKKPILRCLVALLCVFAGIATLIAWSRNDSSRLSPPPLRAKGEEIKSVQIRALANLAFDGPETEFHPLPGEYYDLFLGLIDGADEPIRTPIYATKTSVIRLIYKDDTTLDLTVTFYGQSKYLTISDGEYQYRRRGAIAQVDNRYIDESGVLTGLIHGLISNNAFYIRSNEEDLRKSCQIKKQEYRPSSR